MARIMDVREFKADQYELYRQRRTSQFTKFLDKSVDFVSYYHINQALTTTVINDRAVDSYIGDDSPVRYNLINNMPVYGFPVIDTVNDYDEEIGFNADSFEGTIIILQEVIEPVEGDCFVLNMYNENYFFRITRVEQVLMRSKPCYSCGFVTCPPGYLPKLKAQVVEEYNALFDNIGTQDKVVVSKNEYNLSAQLKSAYEEIVEYYVSTFYNNRVSVFELYQTMPYSSMVHKYVDKFLIKFMEENRIITFDTVLKNTFVLDFNNLKDSDDYLEYKKTIYWAIANKSMKKFIPASYIVAKKISSPFTLIKAQTPEEYYVADGFAASEPAENKFYFEFDFNTIMEKWNMGDTFPRGTCFDKVMAIIVNYLKGNMCQPGYFSDILGQMDPMQEYILLPIILYIIRDNITGLLTTGISL